MSEDFLFFVSPRKKTHSKFVKGHTTQHTQVLKGKKKEDGHQRPVETVGRARAGVLHGEKVSIVLGPENSHRRVHAHLSVSGE